MNVDETVAKAITFYDNLSTLDGAAGNHNARGVAYLQEINDEVWHAEDWQFKIKNSTGTVAANASSLALPTDFEDIGNAGGLWMRPSGSTGEFEEFEEVSAEEMVSKLNTNFNSTDNDTEFAILSETVQFQKRGSAQNFLFFYSKAPQVFGPFGGAEVILIPVRYHHSVLLPGLYWKLAQNKNDARDWEQRYRQGLNGMISRERPRRSVAQFLPEVVPAIS